MMLRPLWQRLFVAALCAVLTGTPVATAGTAMLSDATILAELRPTQNSDVEMVLTRDGNAQYVDTSNLPDAPVVAIAEPTPAPPPPTPAPAPTKTLHPKVAAATASPKPKPVAQATVVPKPVITAARLVTTIALAAPNAVATLRNLPSMPATARPTARPTRSAAVIKPVAHVGPPPFVPADTRTFVAPATVPKPSNSPTPLPVPVHDANWAYEHRFDTPSEDVPIPGIPVRSQASSPFGRDTGAFHGVRARNGYSALRVVVSIPCGVAHFESKNGLDVETGYIYIGGWGAGNYGVAVDAGLQKSSAQNSTDDYAFYWKYGSNRPFTVSNGNRFPCGGPDVSLEIYAVSNDLMVFAANGVTADGVRRTLIAIQRTKPEDGWIPGGGTADNGIIMKRIVSIAQPPGWTNDPVWRTQRWSSGTYFGIGGPSDPSPKIAFKKCLLGHVVPPSIRPVYHDWTDKETWHSPPGSYTDWPPADIKLANHGYCDVAGVYLAPGH